MNTIIWSTGTNFSFPVELCLQTNGFLTIQDFNNNYLWISKLISSSQFGGYFVNIQDDSNIVVYDSQKIVYWSIFGSISGLTGYQLLTNYWPMSNEIDILGGANLYGGLNYSFVPDRFCSANSAIYFNQGYLQIPPGVYFTGDFTVTAWIYLKSYQSYSTIFEFANLKSNAIGLYMFNLTSNIYGFTSNGSSSRTDMSSNYLINLKEWYFIAMVLDGIQGFIYVNGKQMVQYKAYLSVPIQKNRTNNYFGKGNWYNLNSDAIFDEIKIYQVALTPIQIINEYNISSSYSKL